MTTPATYKDIQDNESDPKHQQIIVISGMSSYRLIVDYLLSSII